MEPGYPVVVVQGIGGTELQVPGKTSAAGELHLGPQRVLSSRSTAWSCSDADACVTRCSRSLLTDARLNRGGDGHQYPQSSGMRVPSSWASTFSMTSVSVAVPMSVGGAPCQVIQRGVLGPPASRPSWNWLGLLPSCSAFSSTD
jgi:hypothetical protein